MRQLDIDEADHDENRMLSLNAEQQLYLCEFGKQWFDLGNKTVTDQSLAETAITQMYEFIGVPVPTIKWYPSPAAMISEFITDLRTQFGNETQTESLGTGLSHLCQNSKLFREFSRDYFNPGWSPMDRQDEIEANLNLQNHAHDWREQNLDINQLKLIKNSNREVANPLLHWSFDSIYYTLDSSLLNYYIVECGAKVRELRWGNILMSIWTYTSPGQQWVGYHALSHHLGSDYTNDDIRKFEIWKSFLSSGVGWCIPLNNKIYLSHAPTHISWSESEPNTLQADGQPAIRFADGYEIWVYNGIILFDPKYHIPSKDWQASWLEHEKDGALRQLLIEILSYRQ
jgi:hypothetical protein